MKTQTSCGPVRTAYESPSVREVEMEKRGVVCLPATGYQDDGATAVTEAASFGNYWTASKSGTNYKPYYFYFQAEENASSSMSYQGADANAAFGFAVRLVTSAN